MSVFEMLRNRYSGHAGKRSPDQLIPGVMYKCYKFVLKQSDYEDKKTKEKPMCLITYIHDPNSSNKYYVTCPSIFNNLDQSQVDELNSAIERKEPPFVVFYGKDGMRNDLVIHQFGEVVDEEKLSAYQNAAEEPARKRQKVDSSSSSSSDASK